MIKLISDPTDEMPPLYAKDGNSSIFMPSRTTYPQLLAFSKSYCCRSSLSDWIGSTSDAKLRVLLDWKSRAAWAIKHICFGVGFDCGFFVNWSTICSSYWNRSCLIYLITGIINSRKVQTSEGRSDRNIGFDTRKGLALESGFNLAFVYLFCIVLRTVLCNKTLLKVQFLR